MTFDWQFYTGNLKWLPERTIFVTVAGSRAYGTSTPTSDTDLRGICVAPKEYYLGCDLAFEQYIQKEPDVTIFDLRKFFKLAMLANPNVLELLYTDPSDHLFVHPLMRKLLDNRDLFLSKKIKHTLAGYSRAQLKRMKGHYQMHSHPIKAPPTRAEFGLPERSLIPADQLMAAQSAIQKKLDSWGLDVLDELDPDLRIAITGKMSDLLGEIEASSNNEAWVGVARSLGFSDNFIELLDLERRYTAKQREWSSYQTWLKERNPARAALEAKYGFDLKHAMHLIRLLKCCREVLTTGKLLVRRPDAEELLSIRNGAWTYEQVIEWAEKEDAAMNELVKESKLPNVPDRHKINQLCVEMIEASL